MGGCHFARTPLLESVQPHTAPHTRSQARYPGAAAAGAARRGAYEQCTLLAPYSYTPESPSQPVRAACAAAVTPLPPNCCKQRGQPAYGMLTQPPLNTTCSPSPCASLASARHHTHRACGASGAHRRCDLASPTPRNRQQPTPGCDIQCATYLFCMSWKNAIKHSSERASSTGHAQCSSAAFSTAFSHRDARQRELCILGLAHD